MPQRRVTISVAAKDPERLALAITALVDMEKEMLDVGIRIQAVRRVRRARSRLERMAKEIGHGSND